MGFDRFSDSLLNTLRAQRNCLTRRAAGEPHTFTGRRLCAYYTCSEFGASKRSVSRLGTTVRQYVTQHDSTLTGDNAVDMETLDEETSIHIPEAVSPAFKPTIRVGSFFSQKQYKERLKLVFRKIRSVWLRSEQQQHGSVHGDLPSYEQISMIEDDQVESTVETSTDPKFRVTVAGADAGIYRVIQYLHMFDLAFDEIESLSTTCPDLFLLSIEGNLVPKTQFLHELGLTTSQIANVFQHNPTLFLNSLQTIRDRLQVVIRLGFPADRLPSLMLRNDWLAGAKPDALYPKLAFLRIHLSVGKPIPEALRLDSDPLTEDADQRKARIDDWTAFFLKPGPEIAWLVRSNLGLLMQSWKSAALDNIAHLRSNGLSNMDILKMLPLTPALVRQNLVATMQEQADYFASLASGLQAHDTSSSSHPASQSALRYSYYYKGILLQSPQILAYPTANLSTRIRFFTELGLTDAEASRIFLRQPALASVGVRHIAEKVVTLASDLSLELPHLPSLLTFSKTTSSRVATQTQQEDQQQVALEVATGDKKVYETSAIQRGRSRNRGPTRTQAEELGVVNILAALHDASKLLGLTVDYRDLQLRCTDPKIDTNLASAPSHSDSPTSEGPSFSTGKRALLTRRKVTARGSDPSQYSLANLIYSYPTALALRMEHNIVPKICVLHAFAAGFLELLDGYGVLGRSLVRDPALRSPTPRQHTIAEFERVFGPLPASIEPQRSGVGTVPEDSSHSQVQNPLSAADQIASRAALALASALKKRRMMRHDATLGYSDPALNHLAPASRSTHLPTDIDLRRVRDLAQQAALDNPFQDDDALNDEPGWEDDLSSDGTFDFEDDGRSSDEINHFKKLSSPSLSSASLPHDSGENHPVSSAPSKLKSARLSKNSSCFHSTSYSAVVLHAPARYLSQVQTRQSELDVATQLKQAVRKANKPGTRTKGNVIESQDPLQRRQRKDVTATTSRGGAAAGRSLSSAKFQTHSQSPETEKQLEKDHGSPSRSPLLSPQRLAELNRVMAYLSALRASLKSSSQSESQRIPLAEIEAVLRLLTEKASRIRDDSKLQITRDARGSSNEIARADPSNIPLSTATSPPLDLARRVSRFSANSVAEQLRAPETLVIEELPNASSPTKGVETPISLQQEEDQWYSRDRVNLARSAQQARRHAMIAELATRIRAKKGSAPLIPGLTVCEPLEGAPPCYPQLDQLLHWARKDPEKLDHTESVKLQHGFFRNLFSKYPFRVHEAARELILSAPVHVMMASLHSRILPRLAAVLVWTRHKLSDLAERGRKGANASTSSPTSTGTGVGIGSDGRVGLAAFTSGIRSLHSITAREELERALRQAAQELRYEQGEIGQERAEEHTPLSSREVENENADCEMNACAPKCELVDSLQSSQIPRTHFGRLSPEDSSGLDWDLDSHPPPQPLVRARPVQILPVEDPSAFEDVEEWDLATPIKKEKATPPQSASHIELDSLSTQELELMPGLRLRGAKERVQAFESTPDQEVALQSPDDLIVHSARVDDSKQPSAPETHNLTPRQALAYSLAPSEASHDQPQAELSPQPPQRSKRGRKPKSCTTTDQSSDKPSAPVVRKFTSPFHPLKPWIKAKRVAKARNSAPEELDSLPKLSLSPAMWPHSLVSAPHMNVTDDYADVLSSAADESRAPKDADSKALPEGPSHVAASKLIPSTIGQMALLSAESDDVESAERSTSLESLHELFKAVDDAVQDLNKISRAQSEEKGSSLHNATSPSSSEEVFSKRYGREHIMVSLDSEEGDVTEPKGIPDDVLRMLEAEAEVASAVEERLVQQLEEFRKTGELIDEELDGDVDYAEVSIADGQAIDGTDGTDPDVDEEGDVDEIDDDDGENEVYEFEEEWESATGTIDKSIESDAHEQRVRSTLARYASTKAANSGELRPYQLHPDSILPITDSVVERLLSVSPSKITAPKHGSSSAFAQPFDLARVLSVVVSREPHRRHSMFKAVAGGLGGKPARQEKRRVTNRVLAESVFHEAHEVTSTPIPPVGHSDLFGRLRVWIQEAALDTLYLARVQTDEYERKRRATLLQRAHAEAPGLELVYLAEYLAKASEEELEVIQSGDGTAQISDAEARALIRRAKRDAYLADYADMLWDGQLDSGEGLSKLVATAIDIELARLMQDQSSGTSEASASLIQTLRELKERIGTVFGLTQDLNAPEAHASQAPSAESHVERARHHPGSTALPDLIEEHESDFDIEDFVLNDIHIRQIFHWSDEKFESVFGDVPRDEVLSVQQDLYELSRRLHYLRLLQQPDRLKGVSK